MRSPQTSPENAHPNLATTMPTPQQTWLRSMELASAKADAKEEADHAAPPPAMCAIAAQQELQKLLLGGIQVQASGSGSSAAWWPKLLSYSEAQQALYLRPASKHGNASDRSRRVTRVRLGSIREVRRVDGSQLRLVCAHEECAAPAPNPACVRAPAAIMEGDRACAGGLLYLPHHWPLPNRHLWQLPTAVLCTKAATLLETISEHNDGSPLVRARSSLRLKFTSPRVSRGAAAVTDRSLSLPLRPLPLRRFHSEDNGEPRFSPRLSLTPRRTKCSTPAGRLGGFAEGLASSGKAEIASRSPRCSELMPEKVFSDKVSTLLFSELKRAGVHSRQAAAEATAAESLRVAEAEAAEAKATAAEAEAARQATAVAAGATAKAKEAEERAEAAASAEIEALKARAEGAELRLEQAAAEMAAVREAGEREALALQAALSSEASCSAEEWGELQRQIVVERRVNAGLQAEQGQL